jgi:hypothetical protein
MAGAHPHARIFVATLASLHAGPTGARPVDDGGLRGWRQVVRVEAFSHKNCPRLAGCLLIEVDRARRGNRTASFSKGGNTARKHQA